MTKKEFVRDISDKLGLTQLKTKDVVQMTFDCIIDALERHGRIELRNFGVFEVKQREPRRARNPRTGGEVSVPAKSVVTFKPGKEMAKRIGTDMHPVETDVSDAPPAAPPVVPPVQGI